MARRHARSFVRPAPRTKMWIGAGIGTEALAGNAKVLSSTLSAGALLLRPFTILRTHLNVGILSDQGTAIETSLATIGSMVVTDTAAALGVTAVPDPSGISGDPEAGWFLWQAMWVAFFIDINGTDGIGIDANSGRQYLVDSKAMRKVGPDDNIVTVLSNDTATGVTIITSGRRLIQLH